VRLPYKRARLLYKISKMPKIGALQGKNYLKEREAVWRSGKTPRGTFVKPGIVPKRPLDYLHVVVTPTRVYLPRWRRVGADHLAEKPYMVEVADLPTAIRHEVHKLSGERNASKRTLAIRRSVEMLHSRVYERWENMDPAERGETWQQISKLRNALKSKSRLEDVEKDHRARAVKRLERLLELKKPGDIPATLVGVANDLTAHRNVLAPQIAFTGRMRDAIIGKKVELDENAFVMLDRVSEYMKSAKVGVPKSTDKRKLVEGLTRLRSDLGARPEPELSGRVRGRIDEAIRLLRGNKPGEAVDKLRRGARGIVASNARYAWLYPSRLEQVGGSKSRSFKRIVAERQLMLFRDNLEYWHSPQSHEPLEPKDIRHLLVRIGGLVPGSELETAARRAAIKMQTGDIPGAKEALDSVLASS